MDFQSPDDIETRHKKASKQKHPHSSTANFTSTESLRQNSTNQTKSDGKIFLTEMKSDDEQLSSIEDFLSGENDESFGSDIDLEDDDGLLDEDVNEVVAIDPTVRRSLYMSEKVNYEISQI